MKMWVFFFFPKKDIEILSQMTNAGYSKQDFMMLV